MADQEERGSPSRFADEENHGWAPDVGAGGSERATEANKKAFEGPQGGQGPGREVSDEEREGVPPTDTEARSPLGVGESITKRAEEYGAEGEEGRHTEGRKGPSQRPYGSSDASTATGVDPQEPIDPDMPKMPPGDQGG
jgi:hypothetical protein